VWDQWEKFIVDATDHSKSQPWALESPDGRADHGTGACMTYPQHLGVRDLPAVLPATIAAGTKLTPQRIPRIVWQTHHTTRIPPAGQYIFDMRNRNPE